jgi:hypothetical protein
MDIKDCIDFPDYLELSKEVSNKVGFLTTVFQRVHHHAPIEDFENLGGRVAQLWVKSHKDTGYLLKVFWDTSSVNPVGSHLNFIQGILQKKYNGYAKPLYPQPKESSHAGMETD